MTYASSSVVAQIHRLGQEAEVKIRDETGQNEFGNVTDQYITDRTVLAFRTYPNRNTQVEKRIGDRNQDNPVFLVPIGDGLPNPPAQESHIVFEGKEYEVKSHTKYDTHIEFFGEPVIHTTSE